MNTTSKISLTLTMTALAATDIQTSIMITLVSTPTTVPITTAMATNNRSKSQLLLLSSMSQQLHIHHPRGIRHLLTRHPHTHRPRHTRHRLPILATTILKLNLPVKYLLGVKIHTLQLTTIGTTGNRSAEIIMHE